MLGDEKNFKDISKDSIKDISSMPARSDFEQGNSSYQWEDKIASRTKINKLITALYMVTDTMEKDEPVRLKLRTFGIEILSDTASNSELKLDVISEKMSVILSFLNIARDLEMISEMNFNILKKEFTDLKQSIQEHKNKKALWIEDFMNHSYEEENNVPEIDISIGHLKSIRDYKNSMSFTKGQSLSRYKEGTRIGVQKGSNLMNILKKVGNNINSQDGKSSGRENFEVLKNKRRDEILSIIKDIKNTGVGEGATITDIKNNAKDILASCSEKTLQRELVSMVSDNILSKTGSKRWSKYSLE